MTLLPHLAADDVFDRAALEGETNGKARHLQ